MTIHRPHYCLARVTLEALSAHGIHSGQGDFTHDVLLVRDANGLPALPGSSVAGVLRQAYRNQHGEAAANTLFGCGGRNAAASWLNVSWALVHDSTDTPVEGLRGDLDSDPLLARLLDDKPLVRQRVRLEHTGTAADKGKFDVTLIPAGVRYTGWLSYWCDGSEASCAHWQALLELLNGPPLRLGHGTRSGNGHFKVIELAQARWDLREPAGHQAFVQRPRSRSQRQGLKAFSDCTRQSTPSLTLKLRAEGGWRVGSGEQWLNDPGQAAHADDVRQPDLLPQHEYRAVWSGAQHGQQRGEWSAHYHLLPASAVKGALRHRVAYHYRCLSSDFAEAGKDAAPETCPAVVELFGHANDDDARAGVLVFHDVCLHAAQCGQWMHNRIDRFTGGVINGALFSEEVLWQTPLDLHIDVLPAAAHVSADARKALARTLDDLARGWLPLGASGSRGLGSFIGQGDQALQWSDQGEWINATPATENAA